MNREQKEIQRRLRILSHAKQSGCVARTGPVLWYPPIYVLSLAKLISARR